jgi:hypothetical protein
MIVDNDNDDYAEVVADYIMTYLVQQQAAGRTVVYESEIFKLLGSEIPEGKEDRAFVLKEYTQVKVSDNVVSMQEYKSRIKN